MSTILSWVPADLWIALGLIALIVIAVVGSRIGILPKKSVPYVATAVGGAIAVTLFRRWLLQGEVREFEKAKAEAEQASRELDAMKKEYAIARAKRDELIARYESKTAAHRERILMIDARTAERRREIDTMTKEEQDALIADYVKRHSATDAKGGQ